MKHIILFKTPQLVSDGNGQSKVFLGSDCPSMGLFHVPVAQQTLEMPQLQRWLGHYPQNRLLWSWEQPWAYEMLLWKRVHMRAPLTCYVRDSRPGSQGTGLESMFTWCSHIFHWESMLWGQHRTQTLGQAQASQLQNNSVLSDTSRRISLKTNDAYERVGWVHCGWAYSIGLFLVLNYTVLCWGQKIRWVHYILSSEWRPPLIFSTFKILTLFEWVRLLF